jgi:hypothetical protein
MGFGVELAGGPSVGITYRPPRQKITITVVVDGEQLLAQAGSKREKWLDEQAGVALKLPTKVKQGLKGASTLAELCTALDKRLSPHTPRGLATGSLILQPTAERRRSGSHYTPRALTEPIVKEAFRPWLERFGGQPTAEQVLELKVCDPAMAPAPSWWPPAAFSPAIWWRPGRTRRVRGFRPSSSPPGTRTSTPVAWWPSAASTAWTKIDLQ